MVARTFGGCGLSLELALALWLLNPLKFYVPVILQMGVILESASNDLIFFVYHEEDLNFPFLSFSGLKREHKLLYHQLKVAFHVILMI